MSAREQVAKELQRHRVREARISRPWGDPWQYVGCTCGWEADGTPFIYHVANAIVAGETS